MATTTIQFTMEKRIFMVETYIKTKSPKMTQNLFCKRFAISTKDRKKLVPSKVTILKWVADFKSHGSAENKN